MTDRGEPEGVQGRLRPGERVVSRFGPYYATSHRILLHLETGSGAVAKELSYSDLEGVEEVRVGNRKLVMLGAATALAGLLASSVWGIIATIVGLVLGLGIAVYGAIARPAYYQLHGRSIADTDAPYWRLRHHGAGSFLSSVRTIAGDPPHRET